MLKQQELDEVRKHIADELVCPLKDAATNMVFGKGNPDAYIMFIGEAPGEQEDLQGLPFVGRAGKQLDTLLSSIGLTLDDCYIANILKYRPPGNRDPAVDEIERHTPFLIEQIKIIRPKIIATLGNFSTKFILSRFIVKEMKNIQGVSALHGRVQHVTVDGMQFTVIPLYHPAAMLYKPSIREDLQKDFIKMGEYLEVNHGYKMPKKKDSQTKLTFGQI